MQVKRFLPRSLSGRAALILIVPMVTIQLVVSVMFIQRHFERVTRQMTDGVGAELILILQTINAANSADEASRAVVPLAAVLDITLGWTEAPPSQDDSRNWWDLSGRVVIATLREELPQILRLDLARSDRQVTLWLPTRWGVVAIDIDRRRVSATNPHQLLVLMVFTSALMTLIAFLFLANQLRPITRLAAAAEAFGKGQSIPYRPRGAIEVRAAGRAFLDMRARIERQIEQRTLMLSGVSHDLRTPLTRLRLGLSLLREDEETLALLGDVAAMERLVDEFLAFARGDAMEAAVETDLAQLLDRCAQNAQRGGGQITQRPVEGAAPTVARLRPQAVARAVENLIGNALRFGSCVEVGLVSTKDWLRIVVEDNGPGIPPDRRVEAVIPFVRLDVARDPNRGGAGLGLSIASDIARSHGGELRLGDSARLGGLRAELLLAR